MACYALWDQMSGNLIATFDTEELARAITRRSLLQLEPQYVAAFALVYEDDEGELTIVAVGQDLLKEGD